MGAEISDQQTYPKAWLNIKILILVLRAYCLLKGKAAETIYTARLMERSTICWSHEYPLYWQYRYWNIRE